jgi:hypothetical protein
LRKAIAGVLIGALVFAAAAFAASQQDTVKYRSFLTYKGKASKKKPKNLTYRGVLAIRTKNQVQPDTAPLTELFIAKQIKSNGAKFAGCPPSDIDGKNTFTPRCKKAVVGGGTAKAMLGKTGTAGGFPIDLKVTALNGPKGKSLLLALTGGVLGEQYRVIPGKIKKLKGKYGFKIRFAVPKELREQAGSQVALTDFDVKIKTKKTVKIKHKRASLFQITSCPKSKRLPVQAIVHFNDDSGSGHPQTVPNRSTMKCHR